MTAGLVLQHDDDDDGHDSTAEHEPASPEKGTSAVTGGTAQNKTADAAEGAQAGVCAPETRRCR